MHTKSQATDKPIDYIQLGYILVANILKLHKMHRSPIYRQLEIALAMLGFYNNLCLKFCSEDKATYEILSFSLSYYLNTQDSSFQSQPFKMVEVKSNKDNPMFSFSLSSRGTEANRNPANR